MVKRCCWGTCNTDNRYPDRLVGGIRFIPFPKPGRQLEKANRWIRLCGRPHNQLNESILNERGKAKHLYVQSISLMEHQLTGIQIQYLQLLPAMTQ
uniref:THAP-type domain-containing protein n=1 Tax=Magallana gigas TaxID=29159 RepID=A0A8W8IEJ9_MAGGI